MKHYKAGVCSFDCKTYFLVRKTEDASICLHPVREEYSDSHE